MGPEYRAVRHERNAPLERGVGSRTWPPGAPAVRPQESLETASRNADSSTSPEAANSTVPSDETK